MKSHAKVAVIGGGAMGVSLLYHLAKLGWSDVVLIEKNELTAGSTWHAAGLCTHFAHNLTIMGMRAHSARLYKDVLPEETGDSCGFHSCGALRVTRNPDRIDEFRHVVGVGKFAGYDFHVLTPEELKEIYPPVQTDEILGAIYEPNDGHVEPTLATNAMAKGARARGAEIYRQNEVLGLEQQEDDSWLIRTKNGDITAEIIVNAAGTWCREIGTMMGVDLPMVPMLHQYLVTDRVEAAVEAEKELPIIRDPEESWYVRQERDGFIIGPYEREGHPWSIDGVPPEFGMELLPGDLDRMMDIVACSMERIPALADAGIKTIVNGPITFTPDANSLIGPAFGLNNAWLLCGSSMGVMEGGGAGWLLAEWIVNGEPPMDMAPMDPRRFGDYADRDFRIAKANEAYSRQFAIHYPGEELEAGRDLRRTPVHERLAEKGAVFGFAYGTERPIWFATEESGSASVDSFRRANWFDAVKQECLRVQNHVGLADASVFAKFEVTGPDAARFMETLGANRPPQKIGRVGLTHALSVNGGVWSEFTITKIADDRFYLTCAAAAERHDADILRRHAEAYEEVTITNVTRDLAVLSLMGPKSRAVLSKLTDADLSNAAFPWLSSQEIVVAGVRAQALRVSYVGELGWELHCAIDDQLQLFDALMDAGTDQSIGLFGSYAMNSMRLEKGYRAWGMDLTVERTPSETGVGFLVRSEGREFEGREAMLKRDAETSWSMHLLELAEDGPDPFSTHPIMRGDKAIGMISSGGYGHRVGKKLALAFFREPVDVMETGLVAEILGEQVAASICVQPPYDPDNALLRDR